MTCVQYDPTAWQNNVDGKAFDLIALYDRMGWCDYRRNNRMALEAEIRRIGPCGILDVGCCGGMYAQPMIRAGARYTGVDVTPKFVESARKRNPGVPFEVADARSLPFADNAFDIVFCGGVLQHLVEPEVVAKELHRVASQTVFVEVNVADVPAPWKDVSEPPFIDVWYNYWWVHDIFSRIGRVEWTNLTERVGHGFHSALWKIRKC